MLEPTLSEDQQYLRSAAGAWGNEDGRKQSWWAESKTDQGTGICKAETPKTEYVRKGGEFEKQSQMRN